MSVEAIDSTSGYIYCYTPPASRLSSALYTSGGLVHVYISSNSLDFSTTHVEFSYVKTISIDTIAPAWVLQSQSTTMTVTGTNFYDANAKTITLESSDGFRTATGLPWTHVSSTELTFEFPADTFLDKDFIKVIIHFEENAKTYTVEERVVVYKAIAVEKVKPIYTYTSSGATTFDLFIFGENFWDTENIGLLVCQFDNDPLSAVGARYINQTLIICPAPQSATAKSSTVRASIDNLTFSSTFLTFHYIDAPTITSIDILSIIRTLERVTITLTGANLDYNTAEGVLYISVGDTVLKADVSPGDTSVPFIVPPGLEAGTYEIKVSTDGVNYLAGSTAIC